MSGVSGTVVLWSSGEDGDQDAFVALINGVLCASAPSQCDEALEQPEGGADSGWRWRSLYSHCWDQGDTSGVHRPREVGPAVRDRPDVGRGWLEEEVRSTAEAGLAPFRL